LDEHGVTQQYYIAAKSSPADERARVLKYILDFPCQSIKWRDPSEANESRLKNLFTKEHLGQAALDLAGDEGATRKGRVSQLVQIH